MLGIVTAHTSIPYVRSQWELLEQLMQLFAFYQSFIAIFTCRDLQEYYPDVIKKKRSLTWLPVYYLLLSNYPSLPNLLNLLWGGRCWISFCGKNYFIRYALQLRRYRGRAWHSQDYVPIRFLHPSRYYLVSEPISISVGLARTRQALTPQFLSAALNDNNTLNGWAFLMEL